MEPAGYLVPVCFQGRPLKEPLAGGENRQKKPRIQRVAPREAGKVRRTKENGPDSFERLSD
jgi:hypothetical protein